MWKVALIIPAFQDLPMWVRLPSSSPCCFQLSVRIKVHATLAIFSFTTLVSAQAHQIEAQEGCRHDCPYALVVAYMAWVLG